MSVICLKQNESKLRLSTGSTSGQRAILKAKTPASPEITGEPASFRSLPGLNSRRPDHRKGAQQEQAVAQTSLSTSSFSQEPRVRVLTQPGLSHTKLEAQSIHSWNQAHKYPPLPSLQPSGTLPHLCEDPSACLTPTCCFPPTWDGPKDKMTKTSQCSPGAEFGFQGLNPGISPPCPRGSRRVLELDTHPGRYLQKIHSRSSGPDGTCSPHGAP